MDETALAEILGRHEHREGALLPVLHEIQAVFGHVSEASIRTVAQALNLSRAEVHGVVSFYHDFRNSPEPRAMIKLCRAEACQARGSETLAGGVAVPAGVTIEPVYCLGLCSVGPNAMIGDVLYARLDSVKLAALVEGLA